MQPEILVKRKQKCLKAVNQMKEKYNKSSYQRMMGNEHK